MVQFPIQSLSKKVPHMVIFLQTRIGSLINKGGQGAGPQINVGFKRGLAGLVEKSII